MRDVPDSQLLSQMYLDICLKEKRKIVFIRKKHVQLFGTKLVVKKQHRHILRYTIYMALSILTQAHNKHVSLLKNSGRHK